MSPLSHAIGHIKADKGVYIYIYIFVVFWDGDYYYYYSPESGRVWETFCRSLKSYI